MAFDRFPIFEADRTRHGEVEDMAQTTLYGKEQVPVKLYMR